MAILSATNLLLASVLVLLFTSSVDVATRSEKGKGQRTAPRAEAGDEIEEEAPELLRLPAHGNNTVAANRPSPASLGENLYEFLCGHFTAAELTLLDQIIEANGVYAIGAGSSHESQLNTLLRGALELPRLQAIGLEALGLAPDELLPYVRALLSIEAPSCPVPATSPAPKRRALNRAAGPKKAPAPKAAAGTLHGGPIPGPLRDAGQMLFTTRGPLRFVLPEAGTSAEPPAPIAPLSAVSFHCPSLFPYLLCLCV
jgi:hypothetical protein